MHCYQQAGPFSYDAKLGKYKVLHVGMIMSNDLPVFYKKFNRIFGHASRRNKDQRTSSGGKQGHQRTPAFMHACLRQA
eukprot:5986332-Ditylum_brightwellii.AAC.1